MAFRPTTQEAFATGRPGLSAVIITLNEADRIGDCLDSVAFCDERIVVDAHSMDNTREIAAAKGARVIERDWPGYRSQKEFAVAAARHDWVLCIDADERVSPELRAEIEALRDRGFGSFAGASMRRRNWFFGAPLRFGTSSPDRLTRLFDRRRGGWQGKQVHEYAAAQKPVTRLRGRLHHHPYRSHAHHREKLAQYARLMAEEMRATGRKGSLANIVVNPAWCFLRGFVLRLGFLDGWRGLLFAYREADYVRQKYLLLHRLARSGT
jgi:glycosyltransferase involved in cell wall biosynthesis